MRQIMSKFETKTQPDDYEAALSAAKTTDTTTTKTDEAHEAAHDDQTAPPDDQTTKNLDSGFAWCILLVMFLLQASISGAGRMYGVVYAQQVSIGYYDREQASWPIATASTIENLAGLLTPALASYLSWRKIELLSTGLFIVSNLMAYFSSSLGVDILALGIVQGLALSISTVLALAINNDYFERYRTTAYGISMSGSAFGVLYLSPLVTWILHNYQFRVVYLALAILFCFNILLVLFIRPRLETIGHGSAKQWSFDKGVVDMKPDEKLKIERKVSRLFERQNSVASVSYRARTRRHSVLSRKNSDINSPAPATVTLSQTPIGPDANKKLSTYSMSNQDTPQLSPNEPRPAVASAIAAQFWKKSGTFGSPSADNRSQHGAQELPSQHELDLDRGPTVKPSAEAHTKKQLDCNYQQRHHHKSHHHQHQQAPGLSMASLLGLLRLPYLHCAWIMLALYYLVSRVFIIILVDFADDHGFSLDQSTSLLNYWSLGELVGRIFLGALIDLRFMSCKSCIALTCSTLAGCIMVMVSVEHYYVYAICSMLIATLISLEYMLINVLMIEYIGKAQVTSCYALAAFISSLVLFARPFLIGAFRDHLGSYDGLLMLLAAISLVYATLFLALEPLMVRIWPRPSVAS